jgi:carbon-monoxide dehydrogenase large subunit
MMEVAESDLEIGEGYVSVRGVPGMRKSLREIAVKSIGMPGFSMAGGMEPGLEATAYFKPDQSTYSNSTHVSEVEVDVETGMVRLLRHVVLHDCGRVINPLVVEGQIVGGVAHGIGNALFERLIYDANAQPLTTNLGEYLLPLATDMPSVEAHHMETPSPLNPLGVKGAGEGGTIGSIAAIISAVENALEPFGVHLAEAPIEPQRIVELLGDAALGRTR